MKLKTVNIWPCPLDVSQSWQHHWSLDKTVTIIVITAFTISDIYLYPLSKEMYIKTGIDI